VQAAIEALVDRGARHGVDIDLNIELAYERGRLRTRHVPELETALYRIVQEALTNAARHGGAKRAVVEIHEDASAVHLSVRDDGCGFDAHVEHAGFGLLGMRERVDLLGGELAIDSSPGRGATVRARIPVQRRDEEPASSVINDDGSQAAAAT
jgi:signal transduction histidine kinase